MTTKKNSHFDELGYLQELLEVYEELGGEKNVSQLVAPNRRLLHSEDATVRLHASTAKERDCRIYVFNDLLIVGARRENLTRKSSQGNGSIVWFASDRSRSSSSDSVSSFESDNSDYTELEEEKPKANFKLKMWMDLNKVKPKYFSRNGDHGVYLTYVTMYQQEQKDGSVRWDTQVDRTEICFKKEETAKRIARKIQDAIDEMSEKVLRGESSGNTIQRSSSVSSIGSDGGESTTSKGGTRKWVRAKKTMEKQRAYSRSSKYSFSGEKKDTPDGVLSLDDVGDRYKKMGLDEPQGAEIEAEFILSFNSPSMGFALSSSDAIGPFISKMVTGGMAEAGGVVVGDRIVQVNDTKIPKTLSWKECANVIKDQEKPIRITFSRRQTSDTEKQKEEEEGKQLSRSVSAASISSEPDKEKKPKLEMENKTENKTAQDGGDKPIKRKKTGTRKWAQKKDRKKSYGNRILTMEDLAEQYLDKGAGQRLQENIDNLFVDMLAVAKPRSDREYKCIRVLQEIHDTERRYVEYLSATVMDYKRPLKMKSKPVKCKDLQNGKPFCEHHKPQRFCTKYSAKKRVDLISKDDMKKIFMNVELILKVNLHLIQALQKDLKEVARAKEEDKKTPTVYDVVGCFASAFEKVTPYFQIYWQYCDEYSNAVSHLTQVRRSNKEFAEELNKLEKKAKTHSLQSMLIQPVQRLCKYPLLFEQLSKTIGKYKQEFLEGVDDPEKVALFDKMAVDIEKAHQSAKKVADKVNTKVGEHQQLQKLAEIYAELGGRNQIKNLVQPWRYHLSTTEVAYENSTAKEKEPDIVYCYMFNDLIVLAKPRNRKSNLRFGKTLTKKRTATLGRSSSISNLSNSRRSSSKNSSRTSVNSGLGRRSTGHGRPELDVVKQIKIKDCTKMTTVPDVDSEGRYGLSFLATEKVVKQVVDEKEGKTKTKHDSNIWKLTMWLNTQEERDSLVSSISKQKYILMEDEKQFQKQQEKHGIKSKKKRYVDRMRNRNTGSDMSRSHNRTESLKKIGSRTSMGA